MPAWLIPAAIQAAEFIGSEFQRRAGQRGQERANEQNIALAREQMAFQERMAHSAESFSERMASTQIQRRMADLKAAGLNPALAYEGSAAAPTGVTAGGSQARVENSVASGFAAQQMREAIKASITARENITRKTDAEVEQIKKASKLIDAQTLQTIQSTDFARINQPHTTRALELQNILTSLGITGAENDQELEAKIQKLNLPGGAKMWLQLVRQLLGAIPQPRTPSGGITINNRVKP